MPSSSTHRFASRSLSQGFDLDSIRTQGFYNVVSPGNGPDVGNFYVTVWEAGANRPGDVNIKQVALSYDTGASYTRKFNGSAWSGWTSIGGGVSSTGSEYNPADYGTIDPLGAIDSRIAIQAALDAAQAAGGGVVDLPPGTFKVSRAGAASLGCLRIGDNTTLRGAGRDLTIIKADDFGNNDVAGVVRTYSGVENTNIVVRDLTIDGNKAGQTGWANVIVFFAGVTPADRIHMDRDIWCINVCARNGRNGTTGTSNPSRGYGFDPHEVVDRFHAINCVAHDNERDGFVLDGVTNFKILGCTSYNNGRYGINLITETFNGIVMGNHVYDNASNNIMVQGDSHHIQITGNHVRGSGEQGIRVRRGGTIINTYVTISDNLIINSARNGINVTGANYNNVHDNMIVNSSASSNNTYFDVSLDQDDGDTTIFTGAQFNVVRDNYAIAEASATNKAKGAYREDLTGAAPSNNFYLWNVASGQLQSKYVTLSATATMFDTARSTFYNARDYSVKGDNATVDTTAARALIDSVSAAGGGIAYFPAGTYIFEGTGTASQGCIALPSNVTLMGDGKGKTIFKVIANTGRTVDITGVVRLLSGAANTKVSIIGITIDGNHAAQGASTANITGIYTGGTGDDGITIAEVEVINCHNGTGNAGYGVRLKDVGTNFTLLNVDSDGNQDGFLFDGVTKVKARGCRARNNLRYGYNQTNGSNGVDLTDCDADGSPTNNVIVQADAYDLRIFGGRYTAAGTEGIRVRRGTTVTDTRVSIIGALIANNQRDGIKLSGACQNTILGNMLRDNGLATNNTYGDITLIQDTTNTGTTANNNTISHNVALATAANKTKYGVNEVATGGDNNHFVFNYGSGQTTGMYLITGTGTTQLDTSVLPAFGSSGQFQFNSANVLTGAAGLTYDGTNNRPIAPNGIVVGNVATPAAVSANQILEYVLKRGNVALPGVLDEFGRKAVVGRHPAFHTWGAFIGGPATASAVGFAAATVTGTGAAGGFSSASRAQSTKRTVITSAAAINSSTGMRGSSANLWRGNAAGLGGFTAVFNFSLSAVDATNSKGFIGVTSTSDLPAASNPSATALAAFGISFDPAQTTWRSITNVAAGTATVADLGANFPVSTNVAYELVLFCAPNSANIIFSLTNLDTGNNATDTVSSNLPASGTFLAPQAVLNTGAGTSAIAIDVASIYSEVNNF